jgi:hypothetical protein
MSNSYVQLKRMKDVAMRRRTAERLLVLRKDLAPIVKLKSDTSLLLATWNIRDFDSNKFKHGPRLPESFFYIAEIISAFDLVAVQEVSRDLSALERVTQILGREWDYIVTDTTTGPGGNDERMAFVYNTEKVWFRKIAGEIVLPKGQTIRGATKPAKEASANTPDAPLRESERAAAQPPADEPLQFARTPFLVAFQSGWFRFSLCTVHIYYGAASGAALARRIEEIEKLAKFFADRQDKASQQEKDRFGVVENYILLGDFNVVRPDHKTMTALKSQGFVVPAAIDGKKVRKEGDHYYDQIAVRVKDARFGVTAGGLYDIYAKVFRDDDLAIYQPHMPDKDPEKKNPATDPASYYRKWRTWQMSDHKPLWVVIDTDFADDYIRRIAEASA